jgi:hypothetical protein
LEPEIALPPETRTDAKALARFVEGELKDATVFLTSSPEEYPVLLQGRRLAFTVKPFVYDEREYRSAPIEEPGEQCETDASRVIHASGLDTTLNITRELLAKNQVLSADRSGRA